MVHIERCHNKNKPTYLYKFKTIKKSTRILLKAVPASQKKRHHSLHRSALFLKQIKQSFEGTSKSPIMFHSKTGVSNTSNCETREYKVMCFILQNYFK